MSFKKELQPLIAALFFISLGGWLLHLRIHPPGADEPLYYIPFVFGLLGVIAVPLLLNSKRSAVPGYLINAFAVVFGTITMAAYSIHEFKLPVTLANIVLRTTFPDIVLLFSKLFIAHAILRHHFPQGVGRLFTLRWWVAHLIGPALVFAAGYLFWK